MRGERVRVRETELCGLELPNAECNCPPYYRDYLHTSLITYTLLVQHMYMYHVQRSRATAEPSVAGGKRERGRGRELCSLVMTDHVPNA